jgi:hypothetical protein
VLRKDAERVAARVRALLEDTPGCWIAVGIERDQGFSVAVRVFGHVPLPELPDRLDGVAIRVERRGIPEALPKPGSE